MSQHNSHPTSSGQYVILPKRLFRVILCVVLLFSVAESVKSASICYSDPLQDGIVRGRDGTPKSSAVTGCGVCDTIRAGDNANDLELHGLAGIDVSTIGGTVVSATVCMSFKKAQGNPEDLDTWRIDAVDFGPTIEKDDFLAPTILNMGSFNFTTGSICFDATAAINDAINNPKAWSLSGSSQWFQFAIIPAKITKNSLNDKLQWDSVESGTPSCITYVLGSCPAVSISGFAPGSGCVGDTIVISGSGFGSNRGAGFVNFNGTPVVTYNSWTGDSISVVVPPGTTVGPITVQNGCLSNDTTAGDFTLPIVAISGFAPATGCAGTTVVISGSGFQSPQGLGVVSFNGTPVTAYNSWSDTSISVEVPIGVLPGPIIVMNDCGAFDISGGTFAPPPMDVTGFSPTIACDGITVVISGSGFGDPQGAGTVSFNGTSVAIYNSWTADSITVVVPAGTLTGPIYVTNDCGVAFVTASNFSTIGPPIIGVYSPVFGCIGDTVSLNGAGFGPVEGTVTFNGTAVITYNSWSNLVVSVDVPAGATTGPIELINDCGESVLSLGDYTVTPPPVITGFDPSNGCTGGTVTITGTGFGAAIPGLLITNTLFTDDFESGSITGYNVMVDESIDGSTQINGSFSARIGDAAGELQINVDSTGYSNIKITLTPRTTADSANERGELYFSSTGTGGPWILIANWRSGDPVVPSTYGLSSPGNNNPNLFFQFKENGNLDPGEYFTFDDILVTGETRGFGSPGGVVSFNGVDVLPADYIAWSDTNVQVKVPPSPISGPISITNPCGQSFTTTSNFNISAPPVITGFSPSTACIGSTITISGSGFGTVQGTGFLEFNGTPPVTYNSWGDTSISVDVPAGATTGTIFVQNSCATNFTTISNFTPLLTSVLVTKIGTPSPVPLGDTITYELRVTNSGGCPAENVIITDVLPTGTTYVADTLKVGNSTYAAATGVSDAGGDDDGSISGNNITFTLTNGLSPGTGGTLEIGGSMSGWFQVTVNSNTATNMVTNSISIVNTDTAFDGSINSAGGIEQTFIQAGDTGPGISVTTNISNNVNTENMNGQVENDFGSYGGGSGANAFSVGNNQAGFGRDIRGYIGFDLSMIPAGATITSATMYVKVKAANPDADYPLHIDHVDIGPTIDSTADDFDVTGPNTPIALDIGTWAVGDITTGSFSSLEVTAAVGNAFSNQKGWGATSFDGGISSNWFQVRIRDDTPAQIDITEDVDFDGAGAAAEEDHPYLAVQYQLGSANLEVRGFVGFDLSAVPANGNITAATLYLDRNAVQGQGSDINPINVDHVDYGSNLTGSDYAPPTYLASYQTSTAQTGLWSIESTSEVISARSTVKGWTKNGSSYWFQVMLSPGSTSADGEEDAQDIRSAETVGSEPYVNITFVTSIAPALITDIVTNETTVTGDNFVNSGDTNFIVVGSCAGVTVTGFIPSSGCIGATVVITGIGFGVVQAGGNVRFNGTLVTTYNTWSDTSISVDVPVGTTTGLITVTNGCFNGVGTTSNFTIPAPPAITGFSPVTNCVGDTVTIVGTGFGVGGGGLSTNIVFSDDFEGGLGSWGLKDDPVTNGTDPLRGGFSLQMNRLDAVTNHIDLTGYSNVTVEFIWSNTSVQTGDTVSFEISEDGVNFTNYATLAATTTILSQFVTIPGWGDNNPTFALRFVQNDAGPNNELSRIDNVRVIGETVVAGGVVWIGGVYVTNIVSWSNTTIDILVPGGVTNGVISLTNSCGSGFITSSNFTVCQPNVVINKVIDSIQLGGVGSAAYPGATITFRIFYTNTGSGPALNISIYDGIQAGYEWVAGSASSPGTFTNQWSIIGGPNQGYLSGDYTSVEPAATSIQWVRFKSDSVGAGADGVVEYKVRVR